MVRTRRTTARQRIRATKGAVGGSRAPRAPQRPSAGETRAPTHHQTHTRRIATGGRVPAIVRNRMAPQGRSATPVDEEEDIDDNPGEPAPEGGGGSGLSRQHGGATALLDASPLGNTPVARPPERQTVDRRLRWADLARTSVTDPTRMRGNRGAARALVASATPCARQSPPRGHCHP